MSNCVVPWQTTGWLLLAAACCLTVPAATSRADEPGVIADDAERQWQLPATEDPWDGDPLGEHVMSRESPHLGRGGRIWPFAALNQPLHGTSWLNRPYYFGAFCGTWLGDSLISNEVSQESGFFSGYRFGTDLTHHWGSELRLSLFYINTYFPDDVRGVDSRNLVGDVNLLYYPWGDTRWRPYGSIGLGVAGFHFVDQDNVAVDHTGLQLPIGLGVKYLCRNWLAMRLDIKDNIVFSGNRVNNTDSWSFVGSVELRWGTKSSARYLPW